MDGMIYSDRQTATRWVVRCMVVVWGMFFASMTHAQAIGSIAGLTFGPTAEGSTSAAQSFTVQNTGTKTLNLTGFGLTGNNATSFTYSTTCQSRLGAGSRCSVSVRFAPKTSPGTLEASLDIRSNAISGPSSVSLSGQATTPPPVLQLSATSVAFGSVGTSTTSGPRTIVVSNLGKGTLNVGTVALSNGGFGFNFSNGCSGAQLVQNGSCTIGVTFTPASAGAKSDTLRITTNASTTPASVALTGTGVAPTPVLTLSATRLTLNCPKPYGGPVTSGVSVTNTGTAAITGLASSITTGQTSFSRVNTCPATLGVGAGCNIAVVFTPTGKATRTGILTVTSVNPAAAKTVSLSGTCSSHPSP